MGLSKAEKDFHRKTATACFNRAWDLLERKRRDSGADAEMLHLAHASRYHWGVIGGARQKAVGDWQLGRVYAAIGDSDMSLLCALSCLSLCEKGGLDDLLPSAMEGVARAYLVAGDRRNAAKLIGMAKAKMESLALDAEDRKVYSAQIRETESLIKRNRTHIRPPAHS